MKGVKEMDAAVTEIVESAYMAGRIGNRVMTPNEVYDVLGRHGLTLIDDRIIEALDSMPFDLEDMIEEDEEED